METTITTLHEMNRRKRPHVEDDGEFSNSDEDGYTNIAPTASMSDLPKLIPTLKTQDTSYNIRPHRSTANYGCSRTVAPSEAQKQPRVKRRHTEPRNQTPQQLAVPGGTLATPMACDFHARRPSSQTTMPRDTSAQTNPEVLGLLSGQTRINVLHVEDRNHNLSIAKITRLIAEPLLQTSQTIIGNEGMVVDIIIQRWRLPNGDLNVDNDVDEGEPLGSEAHTVLQHGSSQRSEPIPPEATSTEQSPPPVEALSSSYIDHDIDPGSDELCDEEESDEESLTSETETESSQSGTESREMQPTTPKEPSPPPLHGYPRANEPYRENVLPHDAIRRDDSTVVWNAKDQIDTSCVLWDSGTDPNFIAIDKAKSLGFSPIPLAPKDYQIYRTLAGQKDLATHYIKIDLAINSVGLERHTVYFLCVDTSEVEIVLGYLYIGEHKVFEKLVAKKSLSRPKAFVIFTKKASKEEIQRMLKDKEIRRKKAEVAEARIQAQLSEKKGNSKAGSITSADAMGVHTTVEINSSMAKHQDNSFSTRKLPSVAESASTSSTGSSFFRESYDSLQYDRVMCISPATTFSSQSTASSSSGLRSSMGNLPEKLADSFDRFKRKAREETGSKKNERKMHP